MAKSNTKFRLAVLDGDVLRYRCPWAVEYTLYHVEGLSEPFRGKTKLKEYMESNPASLAVEEEEVLEPVENAIQIAKNYIAQTERRLGCPVKIILSGKTNFREDIATIKPYKGNRVSRKPTHYDALTEWFISGGAVVTDGIEADDLLAIEADEDVVICTNDKDLDQVPGWHYNFITDELYHITEEEGWYLLCKQILTGDSTDNIQGIPGMGTKKAEAVLEGIEDREELWRAVVSEYERVYGDKYQAFLDENATLIYMLRYPEDYWESPYLPEDYFGEER